MYRKALRSRKIIFNIVKKDIQKSEYRTFTTVTPMFSGRTFWGAIFSEIDFYEIFDKTIVPQNFINDKYPFFQIIVPLPPFSNEPGKLIYERY